MSRTLLVTLLVAMTGLASTAPVCAGDVTVAVFNFRMKSDTPEWQWLEKALADRLITDLYRADSIAVVDRDTMQRLSSKVHWVPEMMTDPDRLAMIKRSLRPAYLVSGVYTVKNGTLSITAVVVDMATRKEVARREVAGAPDDALNLSRQLSAEVLSWLTGQKPERVLAELPVWTRSLPAARALYEGVALYDQGRYSEAWLKFRRAAQADRDYVEAGYWVGKMYYFMDRYRHARRQYERFLYTAGDHPRLGDALKEYLHTYEKSDTSVETLMTLCEDLERRWPNVPVHVPSFRISLENWLKRKRAHMLAHVRRYGDAVSLVSKWYTDPTAVDSRSLTQPYMVRHHLLSGHTYTPAEFRRHLGIAEGWQTFLHFDRKHLEHRCSAGGASRSKGDRMYKSRGASYTLFSPKGQVFKTLAVFPSTDGPNEGVFRMVVSRENQEDVVADQTASLAGLGARGMRFNNLPRGGWFILTGYSETTRPLDGFRIVATLEKMPGSHGSIDVACVTTDEFEVRVDGRVGRRGTGIVGLVPPGRHTLTFNPIHATGNYDPWRTTVTVRKGETTSAVGQLPWRPDSPFAGWSAGTLLGRDYAIPDAYWDESNDDPPCLVVDDEAIRVLWSYQGDIWGSVSLDGREFSSPKRLELPVSSGWTERWPSCVRDESGRFVMVFVSNRGAEHEMQLYSCWSRDFTHWSAPVLIEAGPRYSTRGGGVILDCHGRVCFARWHGVRGRGLVVGDGLHGWKTLGSVGTSRSEDRDVLVQRDDGRYEMFCVTHREIGISRRTGYYRMARVTRHLSVDGVLWAKAEVLVEIPILGRSQHVTLSATHVEGRSIVMVLQSSPARRLRVFRETPDGWQASPWIEGVAHPLGSVAYHRRWGYILTWLVPKRNSTKVGPYLTRGKSVDALFATPPTSASLEYEALVWFDLARGLELANRIEEARKSYNRTVEKYSDTEGAKRALARLAGLRE